MLMPIGNVKSYVNILKMQKKAMDKMNDFVTQQAEAQDRCSMMYKTARKSNITIKLKAGQKLSPSEMNYLRENEPELYRKAVRISKDREEFKDKLKQCKTKNEVIQVKVSSVGSFAGGLAPTNAERASDTNEFVLMRIMAVGDEYSGFVRSGKYGKLPESNKQNVMRLVRADRVMPSIKHITSPELENAIKVEGIARKYAISKLCKRKKYNSNSI